MPLPQLAHAR